RLAVEGAELAIGDAHVRVIRIRVDDERDNLFREARVPRFGGQGTQLEQRRLGEEPAALGAVQALTVQDLVANRVDHCRTTVTPRPLRRPRPPPPFRAPPTRP